MTAHPSRKLFSPGHVVPHRRQARRVRIRAIPRPVLGPPQRVAIPDTTPSQTPLHRAGKRSAQPRYLPGAHNRVPVPARRELQL